jgi:deoxyribodipyrimidine photo-lyase
MTQEKAIFWFRRDLRLFDNAGLHAALLSGYPVLPLFIFDTEILSKLENRVDRRVEYIYQALQQLNLQLKKFGSRLIIRHGKPVEVIKELTGQVKVVAVFTNRDYEPYARRRDADVEKMLNANGIGFQSFKDQVIFEPGEVMKPDGKPYTIYTPYSKRWKSLLQLQPPHSYPSEHIIRYATDLQLQSVCSLDEIGFQTSAFQFQVPAVSTDRIRHYHETRDYPAIEGTTRLSVHLRFGTVSIRELVRIARNENEAWLGELIWREFFMTILYFFPQVTQQSFKPAYDSICWRNNEDEFERWCRGRTGYPIVDAGMRELLATGHMHNRVRMIVASFLTKHLLIDWRWGEAWFAQHLLDYDLSANNGNWQWAAGCGCDAAPYFRIFNPYEQTKKFDSRLEYIGKWVPELKQSGYEAPMVDHSKARLRALEAYKKGLASV